MCKHEISSPTAAVNIMVTQEPIALTKIATQPKLETDIELGSAEPVARTQRTSSHLGASKKKRPRITLEWRNLQLEVPALGADDQPQTKQILNGLTGRVEPGQLLALMGPSGAGKTTLLNCLSGGNQSFTGEVLLNSKPWDNTLKRCAAYVKQDDLFCPLLTVREHLMVVAKLRMDHALSEWDRSCAVNDAITTLGLTKCQDTVIGEPGVFFHSVFVFSQRCLSACWPC